MAAHGLMSDEEIAIAAFGAEMVKISRRQYIELMARASLADKLALSLDRVERVGAVDTGAESPNSVVSAERQGLAWVGQVTDSVVNQTLGNDLRQKKREDHIQLLGGFIQERRLVPEFQEYKRLKKQEERQRLEAAEQAVDVAEQTSVC